MPRALIILLCLTVHALAGNTWRELPQLPDDHGFAGSFAGVAGGKLLVAGGANFPEGPPWEGGKKVWHDPVFILDKTDGQWRQAGKLPGARGYGVSITTPQGVLCIGGSDAERHFAECFLLTMEAGELESLPYPALPMPLAEMTGALLGNTVHIVGGIRQPGATSAENVHLTLDLAA